LPFGKGILFQDKAKNVGDAVASTRLFNEILIQKYQPQIN